MPFTSQELENIANAAIDFHFQRGTITSQTIQDKPLLKDMMGRMKTFPGGKGNITVRVKGDYTTAIQGFENDDTVTYGDPANIKTAIYPWKLIHAGIQFTHHELLNDGISVTDSETGSGTSNHTDREKTALANLLQDKLEDMQEGIDRGFNNMFWKDGSQDSKQVPGLQSIILDDPTSATVVAGLDQSQLTWWRNRASLGLTASTASDLNVINTLQAEFRQLRRYGGKISKIYAGSDAITWIEKELRSKGNFTLDGWAKGGKIDASIADLTFKGVDIMYDPTLDDLGRAKYFYCLDTRFIYPMVIEGENMKTHTPARPENKYVYYRAKTWAGGLVCKRRNVHGVYSIA